MTVKPKVNLDRTFRISVQLPHAQRQRPAAPIHLDTALAQSTQTPVIVLEQDADVGAVVISVNAGHGKVG